MHPHLVLHREAARRALLHGDVEPELPCLVDLRGDFIGGFHLDSQVVQRARLTVTLDENQLERRIGHGEVGVAWTDLGRSDTEHLRIMGDCLVEVPHVESKLNP